MPHSEYNRERAQKAPTFALYFRRYAPFESFGGFLPVARFDRFHGDNRLASTSLKVTSRTSGCVMFNKEGLVYRYADADFTEIHIMLEGDIVGHAKVSMTFVEGMVPWPDGFDFSASTSGAMPLLPGSPNIDTLINVSVDFSLPSVLQISGEVFGDNFPNLEVFLLCTRSTHTALLLDGRTTGGRDSGLATRLWGSHSDFSLGKFSATLPLTEKGQLKSDYKTSQISLPDYPPPATMQRGGWSMVHQ